MKTLRQIQQMITSINDWETPLRQGVSYLWKGCFVRLFHSSRLKKVHKIPIRTAKYKFAAGIIFNFCEDY